MNTMNMSQDAMLLGLCELFILLCYVGEMVAASEKLKMNFVGAGIFASGILFLSVGVFLIRNGILFFLFTGIVVTIFGGIGVCMGVVISVLFFKDDEIKSR